jgi:CRISPR-associated protein Csb1
MWPARQSTGPSHREEHSQPKGTIVLRDALQWCPTVAGLSEESFTESSIVISVSKVNRAILVTIAIDEYAYHKVAFREALSQSFAPSPMPLRYDQLVDWVDAHAAIRRIRRLQPVGGPGDKVFPATYPNEDRKPPRHATEMRRVAGQDVPCVLIDSVQSAANRLEDALLRGMAANRLSAPHIAVDFSSFEDLSDVGTITELAAPHRAFDAILRDSETADGTAFRKTPVGEAIQRASTRDCSALLAVSPVSLLMGAWNSTGDGGGLGAKFPRAVVAEIVGYGWAPGTRTSSRIDPLGARATVPIVGTTSEWQVGSSAGKSQKAVKPSEVNHGNIRPDVQELGGTFDYAVHSFVLSFAALRRLGFGGQSPADRVTRERAARTVLAALGLVALLEGDRAGYALRSRCDLVLDASAPAHQAGVLEVVHDDGTCSPVELTLDEAYRLFNESVAALAGAGLAWSTEPVRLRPQARLVDLVRASRKLALADVTSSEDD